MSSILLSFCNLSVPRRTGLLRFQVDSEATSEVLLGVDDLVESCTGLAIDNDNIYLLFVSQHVQHLGALSRADFRPVFHQPLLEIKDGHSIMVKDRYLYVVSTGSDAGFRYELTPMGASNPTVIWRASKADADTHHVNSIIEWQGSLAISAFGPKFGSLWASAMEGYIHDISRDRRIKGGIYHPHSLSARGDRLYYYESYRKLFWCLEGPIASLDGYSRGVCWLSNEFVCLGNSVGRRVSKSTRLIANAADPGEPAGNCGIVLIDIANSRTVRRVNLRKFGSEIYDLLIAE